MDKKTAAAELEPILEKQRRDAGLFEPVARGMELSVAQQIENMKGSKRINTTDPYESGFRLVNGRYE